MESKKNVTVYINGLITSINRAVAETYGIGQNTNISNHSKMGEILLCDIEVKVIECRLKIKEQEAIDGTINK